MPNPAIAAHPHSPQLNKAGFPGNRVEIGGVVAGYLHAYGKWNVLARKLPGEQICADRDIKESPPWETNERVILAKIKYTGVLPLILRC